MAMSELGAYLQRQREERGWSLEELEAMTRIRRPYLEAMEAGDWESLPPGVYTRGLLKSYAKALGLSTASVQRMYVKERPREAALPEPQLISRPLVNEPRFSPENLAALVFAVAAVAIVFWIVRGYVLPVLEEGAPGGNPTAAAAGSPAGTLAPGAGTATRTATPGGRPGTGSGSGLDGPATVEPLGTPPPARPGIVTATASPAAPGTGTPGAGSPGPTPSASGTPGAAGTATRGAGGTVAAAAASGLLIEVQAAGNSWLRIDTDGEQAYEGFLREGEAWKGTAQERVRVRMGNAGDTQITLNGTRLDPQGGRGEVVEREWRLLPNGDIEQLDQPG